MKLFIRGLIYCIGLVVLALGLVLYTKTNLGVSPIMSIPYSITVISSIPLGYTTFVIFLLCTLGQLVLRGKRFRLLDILQIPLSLVHSMIINFLNEIIHIQPDSLLLRFLILIAAIFFTGLGAYMTVETKIMPTAADGFAQAIAERMGKGLGLAKNTLDISCVAITVLISLIMTKSVIGIGIGTLASVLGVGRTIALINYLFKNKMQVLNNAE